MFCVFLQNIPPNEYSSITITHNDVTYTLSKDLALTNCEYISDMMKKSPNGPLNLDYEHEYDDFQLISDLFNYKRIFITKINIDFLEYSANYLKIPILIKKTIKFRNHYNEFLKNPIFKEIKSLRQKIFSLSQSKTAYDDSDDSDDDLVDSESHPNDENANNNENNNDQNPESKIDYKPGYSSTVAHLIFAACLSNPLNIETYVKIVANDQEILDHFLRILHDDADQIGSDEVSNILYKSIREVISDEKILLGYVFRDHSSPIIYDTNLRLYFNKEIGLFYKNLVEMANLLGALVNMIKDDDVDSLQRIIVTDESISKDAAVFESLFQFSAILSATKCFKYFLLNHSLFFDRFKIDKDIVRSAIIGGNIEIFRLSLAEYSGQATDFIKDSILFHRTNILKWLITNDIQFLSIYNCSCSVVLYQRNYIRQKWYHCTKCHPIYNYGMCKFCAKHCHLNKDGEDLHNPEFTGISTDCFCDDDCPLSQNIEIIGTKKFVEIDDLILLSIYCMNTSALKVLIDEGAYILRCRDRLTRSAYSLGDEKLIELVSSMHGYKDKFIDEIYYEQNNIKKHSLISVEDLLMA